MSLSKKSSDKKSYRLVSYWLFAVVKFGVIVLVNTHTIACKNKSLSLFDKQSKSSIKLYSQLFNYC